MIVEVSGGAYAAIEMVPRYDLAYWIKSFGHVESTRYCNFACSFCSLTGEGRKYQKYALADLRRQIVAYGHRRFLLFIDNNFYGNDSAHFRARLELIGGMHREGWFKGFGALVTSDFFIDPENLRLAHAAGCRVLSCGLETFDQGSLARFQKRQNTVLPQVEMVRKCLEAGILFVYGLIADVATRSIESIRAELDFATRCKDITLPTFVVLPIPFPGTPFFREMADANKLLPGTRLRDLDGTTLCLEPVDSVEEVGKFVSDLQNLRGYRRAVVQHAFGFTRRYWRKLGAIQLAVALARDVSLTGMPSLVRAGAAPFRAILGRRDTVRTHVSTTEKLDQLYTPTFPVDPRYRSHFEPTKIVGDDGRLVPHLAQELLGEAPTIARRSATAGNG